MVQVPTLQAANQQQDDVATDGAEVYALTGEVVEPPGRHFF